jgi:RHS repeat-associated protein
VQEQRDHIKKTYIYEPESFKPVAMVQDGEIYHYHLDHLGTPKELSDKAGKIVWKAHYKTYGNLAVKEVEEVENNLRFQGQYFDEETGLHYNRHRYYNPSSGQFISQDPIGLLGGVNGYQYAPNPVGWVDPFGLTCKEQKYPLLKEMDSDYRAEELGFAKAWEGLDVEVEYLDDESERTPYEIFVKDGLITDASGAPLDTGNSISGKYIFVMDPQGRVFAGAPRIFEFHHSSFLASGDVASAGEIEVASGLLLRNNSESGHYKPTEAHNDQFVQEMSERGINAEQTREYRNED